MFKRLRRWLTLICAAGTTLVLVLMALVGLQFSVDRLYRQQEDSFTSSLNNIFFYLQGQQAIDQIWLSQTEASGHLYIGIESGDTPLQFVGQDATRQQLVNHAMVAAVSEYGFERKTPPKNPLEPETTRFNTKVDGVSYRAAVSKLGYKNGWLTVVVMKSKSEEQAVIRNLRLVYAAWIAVGAVALAAFAWFFTGRALRPAEISQKKQNEFLAAASHELRSPLAVVQMSAGSIKRMPENAAIYADKIEAECERMSRLIADLLMLAGSDGGRLELLAADVSPKTLVLSSFERFEGLAGQKQLRLELVLEPQPLPDVRCDAQRIEQLLAVLLDNALHYTPEGGTVYLGARMAKAKVEFFVEDSGPGISDEHKMQIFDRFFRADASRTTKEHYGLGLSVAQEIATLHGGRLKVMDSSLGGAAFVLALPPSSSVG